MNQQLLNHYLQLYKDILNQVTNEVNKLHLKQEEINKREQNILQTKDNTTQILNLLQMTQKQSISNNIIQSLNKAIEIEHKSTVYSIIELNNSQIATGDYNGYINLFAIDYKEQQWTKIKEYKAHKNCITSLCILNGNKLISSSYDNTLKVWNISNNIVTYIKTLEGHDN